MGIKNVMLNFVLAVAVIVAVIVFIPGIPPYIEPVAFHVLPPRKVEGWFATNSILDEGELVVEMPGAESVAVQDDSVIFTGNQLGTVIEVTGKQVAKNITTLKFPCSFNPFGTGKEKDSCGWPLGMRLDNLGFLYTLDYYGGLTKVNIRTGEYENLIPKDRPIEGKFAHVPEDLDIAKGGTIYWTDGSTTGDFFVEMLGQPSGRLLKYDPVLRKTEVLLENLHFSNGVCLSDDETFVLVAESGSSRITRYFVSGSMKGKVDVFVDSLPGYPDNIRSNGRGGFYVALVVPWNDEYSMKVHLLAPRPLLRKLILRSRYLLLSLIRYLNGNFMPHNVYLDLIENYIVQNGPILNISKMPKTATIIELSKSGEILGILNGKSGKISAVSQITVGTKYAFLSSPFEGKIWRIKLSVLRRMH